MATLTLTLVVGANTFPTSVTLSNADAARIQAWATALYGPGTNQVMWNRAAKDVFKGLVANVRSYEEVRPPPLVIPDIPLT